MAKRKRQKPKQYPQQVAEQIAAALDAMETTTKYRAEGGYVLALRKYCASYDKVFAPIDEVKRLAKATRDKAKLLDNIIKLWKENGYE